MVKKLEPDKREKWLEKSKGKYISFKYTDDVVYFGKLSNFDGDNNIVIFDEIISLKDTKEGTIKCKKRVEFREERIISVSKLTEEEYNSFYENYFSIQTHLGKWRILNNKDGTHIGLIKRIYSLGNKIDLKPSIVPEVINLKAKYRLLKEEEDPQTINGPILSITPIAEDSLEEILSIEEPKGIIIEP